MKKIIIIISAVLILGTLNAQEKNSSLTSFTFKDEKENLKIGNLIYTTDESAGITDLSSESDRVRQIKRLNEQHNAPIVDKITDDRWFGALRINCESLEEKIEIQLYEYQKDGMRSGSNLDEAEQLAVVYTALCKQ